VRYSISTGSGFLVYRRKEMRKKFTIYRNGVKYKPKAGCMVVMNVEGVFFQIGGMDDYYMGLRKLSDVIGNYDVVWKGEESGITKADS
jgi:hypothetical protein